MRRPGTVVATIPLTGTAETGQSDGAGKVFVNIEDKDQIDVIDVAAKKVVGELAGRAGQRARPAWRSTHATHRLFVGAGKLMVMMDCDERQGRRERADLHRHRRDLVRRRHEARVQLVPRRQDHVAKVDGDTMTVVQTIDTSRRIEDDGARCGDAQAVRDGRQAERRAADAATTRTRSTCSSTG